MKTVSVSKLLSFMDAPVRVSQWRQIMEIVIVVIGLSCIYCQDTKGMCHSKDSNAIDDFINNLNYTNDEVLAYMGDSKTHMPSHEGKLDNKNDFIVITRTKKNLKNEKTDIGIAASNEHQSYPGALLLANRHLVDNFPDVVAVDRAPITYTINLPGLTSDEGFTIVPSFSEFQSSANKALHTWFDKYPKDQEVVANFESDHCFAYSQELLRVKFGIQFKNTIVESNIDFDAVKKMEKLIMIYKFKQIFYTISVQSTKKPSDLFDCDLTLKDLQKKVNDKNPPVIVDSVSYGRTIYVKLDTSSTDKKAKALLENKLSKFFINNKNEINYEKHLKDLSMQVYVIGGGSDHIDLVNARSLQEVNDVIVRNGKLNRKNLGYPISYSAQFIKDNSRAVVNMATEYIETTRSIHKKGVIKIIHHGMYVAQWNVSWQEISYDKEGKKIDKKRNWVRNGQKLTAPFEEEIELPGNTESINVVCRYVSGVPWQWWRTLINSTDIDLIDRREFKVSGTTLMPKHSITPEAEKGDDDSSEASGNKAKQTLSSDNSNSKKHIKLLSHSSQI